MPHPTGPSNPNTRKLIAELKKSEYTDLAKYLAKPARNKKVINISRISKMAKKYNSFAVPTKLLSTGSIDKPVTVYAYSFSKSAREKIVKAGGKALPISSLLKEKVKAKTVV